MRHGLYLEAGSGQPPSPSIDGVEGESSCRPPLQDRVETISGPDGVESPPAAGVSFPDDQHSSCRDARCSFIQQPVLRRPRKQMQDVEQEDGVTVR